MEREGNAAAGDEQAQGEAGREYQRALELAAGDVVSDERLASLYISRLKQPDQAELVLDKLLKARPDSAEARLARYRVWERLNRQDRCSAELQAAEQLAGGDFSVGLASVGNALRRGDNAGARRQIGTVSAPARDDLRLALARSRVDLGAEHPEEVADDWRLALAADATGPERTWWLAYSLI